MSVQLVKSEHEPDVGVAEKLYAATEAFVPRLRSLQRKMAEAGRLDDQLVADMDAAGIFSLLVPKSYGGAGLGPHEFNKVIEIIGSGDCSTGWVASFYNIHNWLMCRFPPEIQKQLFNGRSSVLAAAVWSPPGTTERVDGGYLVTGKWGYATGIHHAAYGWVPALVGDKMCWFVIPKDQLTIYDDWDMRAMAATGSVTISADKLFVPDGWWHDIAPLMTASQHHGSIHPEPVHSYSFTTLVMGSPSMALGAVDAAVEICREKLLTSSRLGVPLVERPPARLRWIRAFEAARILRMLRDGATEEAIRRGPPSSLEEESQTALHLITFCQQAKDILRDLVDGNGSSGYRGDDVVLRHAIDVAVLATHAAGMDYDSTIDRHARWTLGLGLAPGDPNVRFA